MSKNNLPSLMYIGIIQFVEGQILEKGQIPFLSSWAGTPTFCFLDIGTSGSSDFTLWDLY
jgi:hypothetical protein